MKVLLNPKDYEMLIISNASNIVEIEEGEKVLVYFGSSSYIVNISYTALIHFFKSPEMYKNSIWTKNIY